MKQETITWYELPQDGMPDAETSVLVNNSEGDVDTGFFDGAMWRWCESGGYVAGVVLAWADKPVGVVAS